MFNDEATEFLGVPLCYFQQIKYRMKKDNRYKRYKCFFVENTDPLTRKDQLYLIDLNQFFKTVYQQRQLINRARELYFDVISNEEDLSKFCRENAKDFGVVPQTLRSAINGLFNEYDEWLIKSRKLEFIEKFINFIEKKRSNR